MEQDNYIKHLNNVIVRFSKDGRLKTTHGHQFLQTPNRKDFNMNIDKMEFTAWMKRITNRLDILSEDINGTRKQHASIDGEELLDNQDLLQMLKISPRSLQRYRSSGKLPYYTLSGKLYYKLSDVHQFIRECFTTPVSKTKAKK